MGSSVSVPTPEQAEKLRKDFKTNCRLAAKAIAEANFFCLQTGAGFSADSGLAVYKGILLRIFVPFPNEPRCC